MHPVHGISKTEHPEMAELPESIGNLKNLEDFRCYKNKLTGEYFIPSSPNETSAQSKNSAKRNFPGMFCPPTRVHLFTAIPTEPPQRIAECGMYAIKKWFNDKHVASEQASAAAAFPPE